MPPQLIVSSPSAQARLDSAASWLASRGRAQMVLVLGASLEAARALDHAVSSTRGATFGWRALTLGRAAMALAGPALAERGLASVTGLAFEALCARVLAAMGRDGRLGRFAAVADRPGLPRALARSLHELRMAGVPASAITAASPELGAAHGALEAELQASRLADRAAIYRLATEAARSPDAGPPLVDVPLLMIDVAVSWSAEAALVAALAARSPDVLVTTPAGEERALIDGALPDARREEIDGAATGSLARLQKNLFVGPPTGEVGLGDGVRLLSAPGESRECVEIARLLRQEAENGIPFDRMAVLLRAPNQYRAHLEEALRRAGVPAYFVRGTVRPDPAGRALLALLACAAEGMSARRFAEYLSLGEVPSAAPDGAPPPAVGPADRWVAPEDELLPQGVAPGPGPAPEERDGPEHAAEHEEWRDGPVTAGTLRAPRRWEQLVVDAAVIGGRARWVTRLEGLKQELLLQLAEAEAGEPAALRLERDLKHLESLRGYALPLLEALEALPRTGSWSLWLDALGGLATRALRHPERVLALLAELAPMGAVGPVDLAEVRLVLRRWLTELVVRPASRRAGQVLVAPIEAARGLAFDVVFVPGLAERMFPQKVSEDPLLRDAERAVVSATLPTNPTRVTAERLALRLAVGAASRRVVLSYSRIDLEAARTRVPSFYGLEVLRAAEGKLPGFDALARRAEQGGAARIGWPAPADPTDAIDEAEHDLALLHGLFRSATTDKTGTARFLLDANPHLARALRFRARRWIKRWGPADGLVEPMAEARAALAAHAFGARSYSPTALQNFAACPYKFLLQAVHRLAPREEPVAIEAMDPLERGSLVHEVQFELLTELRDRGLVPITADNLEEARSVLDRVLAAVAERFRERLAPAIPRVWDDGIASIRADLVEWLRRATESPGWTPFRLELAFGLPGKRGRDAGSHTAAVRLDAGIQLRGSIDLVEVSPTGTLRATDHKTGKVRVAAGAVVAGGESLQPVLYALALEKLFPERGVEGGRLYYCTSTGRYTEVAVPLDAAARDCTATVAAIIGDALDRGFLPAAPAARACTWCDYKPVCGPYEELRASKVKSQKELAPLKRLRSLP